jgi:hypothetical protein
MAKIETAEKEKLKETVEKLAKVLKPKPPAPAKT